MDSLLLGIARSVRNARSAEDLTRNLFALLEDATGLESFFLATVDPEQKVFEILHARNALPADINIPEGVSMPWQETVCKHAMDEGVRFTHAADERWPGVRIAQDLKISTYILTPLWHADGRLQGTLCGASNRQLPVAEDVLPVFDLCARLISDQMVRDERAASDGAAAAPAFDAGTDPLTGLADRRTLDAHLAQALQQAARDGGRLGVVYINLDGLGAINERHGRAVGDAFLVDTARRLMAAMLPGEFMARINGGEFVVVSRQGRHAADGVLLGSQHRLEAAATGSFAVGSAVIDGASASVGGALSDIGESSGELLLRADEAMYEAKQNKAYRRRFDAADSKQQTSG